MQSNFKKFLSLGLITLFFTVFVSFSNVAQGSLTDNISGFAWEANDWVDKDSDGVFDAGETMSEPGGAGWISFNCTSDTSGTCVSSDYGVNVNTTTGYMTGYAWSSNYGWIKFGGFSGFPTGSGTTADNAKIDFTGGTANARPVTGWARFCAVYVSGCSGALVSNAISGGWDGWISFSGTGYGVTLNTTDNDFDGYAWGGNSGAGNTGKNVVGWISFNCANTGTCGTSDYKVSYAPPNAPTLDISANPANLVSAGSTTLSWTGANITSCTASETGPSSTSWPGSRPIPPSSFVVSGLIDGTYVFTLDCTGPGGSISDSVSVIVGVGIDLFATPSNAGSAPFQTTLSWAARPANLPAGSITGCTASSLPSVSQWNASTVIPNFPPSGFVANVDVPVNPTQYTLDCFYGSTPVSKTIFVTRVVTESVQLANPGGVNNNLTTLEFALTNVNENTCVASSNPSVPSWNGPITIPPYSKPNVAVPAGPSTTYTLTCTGSNSGNPISGEITLNENSGASFITKPIYIEN